MVTINIRWLDDDIVQRLKKRASDKVFSNLEMRLKPSLFKKKQKTVRNNVEQAMARSCLNKKVYRAVPFFYIFTSIFPLSLSPLKFVD